MKKKKIGVFIIIVLIGVGIWMLLGEDTKVMEASYPVDVTINGEEVVITHDVIEETLLLKNQPEAKSSLVEGKEPKFTIMFENIIYKIYKVGDEGVVEYEKNNKVTRYKIPGNQLLKFD